MSASAMQSGHNQDMLASGSLQGGKCFINADIFDSVVYTD